MPDLTRRLTPAEIKPGIKVDLLPQSGSAACMATRAATATIVDTNLCKCPDEMVYKANRKNAKSYKNMKAGKGSFVVKIEKVYYAPGLIIPKYEWGRTDKVVTLGDIPIHHHIIVPIAMIKEHVDSEHIRTTPIDDTNSDVATEGRSKPATHDEPAADDEPAAKRTRKRPQINPAEGYDYIELAGYDDDEEEEEGFVRYTEYNDEEGLEKDSMGLTPKDIEYLHSALFDGESPDAVQNGRSVLESKYLSDPPDPSKMKNRWRAVLGDVFHAMDRTKVPVHHEAKKAFFVALREAFFVWNPSKLKELEDKMRNNGMTDDEIRVARYFNTQLFRGCVDRNVPPSTVLYWRVRAVYVASVTSLPCDLQAKP